MYYLICSPLFLVTTKYSQLTIMHMLSYLYKLSIQYFGDFPEPPEFMLFNQGAFLFRQFSQIFLFPSSFHQELIIRNNLILTTQMLSNNHSYKAGTYASRKAEGVEKGPLKIDTQSDKLEKQAKVIKKPLIVTRRNTSTAQNKRAYADEEEEDLVYTSGHFKKNQQIGALKKQKQGIIKREIIRERPQSKHQTNRKSWENNKCIEIKRVATQNHRPETSKGQREKNFKMPKFESDSSKSLGNSNEIKNKKQELVNGLKPKETKQSNKLIFKTPIDPEFLSLFAN